MTQDIKAASPSWDQSQHLVFSVSSLLPLSQHTFVTCIADANGQLPLMCRKQERGGKCCILKRCYKMSTMLKALTFTVITAGSGQVCSRHHLSA